MEKDPVRLAAQGPFFLQERVGVNACRIARKRDSARLSCSLSYPNSVIKK